MRFILASGSPRRIELLKEYGYNFEIIQAEVDETTHYRRPHLIVMDIAFKKALPVSQKNPSALVLAADTIVYCDGRILGKPKNVDEAKKMLRLESGKWQSVYTGICLLCINKKIKIIDYEKSRCYMRNLSEKEIDEIAHKHLDKAGGWGVQDKNDILITKIIGSYHNVVGLPIEKLNKILERLL
jgi:septum formation protein